MWLALAACGSAPAAPDARVRPDAFQPDAHTICDPTATFGAPVPIAELDTAGNNAIARFSPTETTVYFETDRDGSFDVYSASRVHQTDPFGAPSALAAVNVPSAFDGNPTVSENGNLLVFDSDRTAGEGAHLYSMRRSVSSESFGMLTELTAVDSSTVTDTDGQPFLSADLQELWFSSTRAGGSGGQDLYRARATANGFDTPVPVVELESGQNDEYPVLSGDLLTVYFASERPNGSGGLDIWTAHRSSTTDTFGTPTPVTELNSTLADDPSWLSLDNCRLYFTSTRGGSFQIYVATR